MPTVDNFFGRVTKARILEAVREAKGDTAAERIAHLRKGDMAAEAERLLAATGWLPEPLRTPLAWQPDLAAQDGEPAGEDVAAIGGETAIDRPDDTIDTGAAAAPGRAVAAE